MTFRERFPDFFRLAKNLRPMIIDFAKSTPIGSYEGPKDAIVADWVPIEQANLIVSEGPTGMHRVVLDIDHDAALIPSTTPGHYHLIIDCPMTWAQYSEVLRVLGEAGVIEKGYARVSRRKRYSAIRTPWTRKNREEAA